MSKSGKTKEGVNVLRFASKIVIKTAIQSKSRSQIYPPQLIIEYEERNVENLQLRQDSEETLIFKTEYTMMTGKYWTTIEVMIGFVSAISVAVWLLRVYNWQNRNKRISADGNVMTDSSEGGIILLKCIAMALNTFVLIFFPFILALCTFW